MYHHFLRVLGLIWYGMFFGAVLPFTMILVSVSVDQLLVDRWGIALMPSWLLIIAGLLFLLASGFVLIISVLALHHEGKAFPWSFGSHAAYNPQKLVQVGPYAVVRHPMGLSYILFLLALGCFVPSFVMLVWIVPITFGLLYEYFEFTEEIRLRHWFGEEYDRYHQRTPSLFPKWRRFLRSPK